MQGGSTASTGCAAGCPAGGMRLPADGVRRGAGAPGGKSAQPHGRMGLLAQAGLRSTVWWVASETVPQGKAGGTGQTGCPPEQPAGCYSRRQSAPQLLRGRHWSEAECQGIVVVKDRPNIQIQPAKDMAQGECAGLRFGISWSAAPPPSCEWATIGSVCSFTVDSQVCPLTRTSQSHPSGCAASPSPGSRSGHTPGCTASPTPGLAPALQGAAHSSRHCLGCCNRGCRSLPQGRSAALLQRRLQTGWCRLLPGNRWKSGQGMGWGPLGRPG